LSKDNSSSYPKLVVNEEMMQTAEWSKEPKTKVPHHPPEMSPLISFPERLDIFMSTTKGSYRAPERAPLTSISKNLDHHGTSRSLLKLGWKTHLSPQTCLLHSWREGNACSKNHRLTRRTSTMTVLLLLRSTRESLFFQMQKKFLLHR
jgi:hypothetical protein